MVIVLRMFCHTIYFLPVKFNIIISRLDSRKYSDRSQRKTIPITLARHSYKTLAF